MILAGDIGGTNTRLGLFDENGREPLAVESYRSSDHAGLGGIVDAFLSGNGADVDRACFGVAGPVHRGHSDPINLAWPVDAGELTGALGLAGVRLINDLEANAYGIDALGPEDFEVLNPGDPDAVGNAAVISAGTGLGEAGMYWDGARHRPFACEGGHSDFAPRTPIEAGLRDHLTERFGHASYERACSGMGLVNINRFLGGADTDPSAIADAALAGTDERAVAALDLMVSIYGSEAGNLALKLMALDGVYLGGGIAPKILPKLRDGVFVRAFVDKGRFRSLLERIPIRVILNDRTALLGAARCCAEWHPSLDA